MDSSYSSSQITPDHFCAKKARKGVVIRDYESAFDALTLINIYRK